MTRSASCTKDQYILDDRVRFWGEGVAAIAAISEEIADEALDAGLADQAHFQRVFKQHLAATPGQYRG